MKVHATVLDEETLSRALIRIAHQITEKNRGCDKIVFVGIKTRGVPLARRISENIEGFEKIKVLTANSGKHSLPEGYGLEIVGEVKLEG